MPATPPIAPIPGLPLPKPDMDWRALNRFRKDQRGGDFYLTCLQYGQHLWLQRFPARSILCLDRAWGADLRGGEPILNHWPLPYAPLAFLLKHAPTDAFLGNPRVHFQHYADRLGEPRREQRKWRSWACWALARDALPHLPGDPLHPVEEPTLEQISIALGEHGFASEVALWRAAFQGS